jgi:hypothetical protein
MTLLATLAAGVARVQENRADIAAEFALGYALDDLNLIGFEIAVSGLKATDCQPGEIPGASPNADGSSSLRRTVVGVGSLEISLCPSGAGCYPPEWPTAEWLVSVVADKSGQNKSLQVGVNSNGDCAASDGVVQSADYTISYWY